MFKVSWIFDFLMGDILGPKFYFDNGNNTPDKTTQIQELPEWARGYAKDVLAQGAALTNVNKNPYQKYGGKRIAGFQPMQEQAFKTMSGMDASPEGFAKGIGTYMSPYMQNVVDIQKREAGRQSAIAGTQQQAQATQAGAFGGGRDAIMRAEREGSLSQQMNDIQARGSQAAYEQAADQFRQGITQQSGLAQMQGQMGQLQQQQAQRPLDTAYQDFQNQQNYPYKQLGFMSDMVRGLPLGQQSTQSIYSEGPSAVQTLAGLGGAAYGFGNSNMFGNSSSGTTKAPGKRNGGLMGYADGGDVKRYAGNYGSVTSEGNVEEIISSLSDQQLAQAKETALNRQDVEQAQMIDQEMAERASIRSGMGSAFNQIPVEQQEAMMAGGGIVAFAPGGTTYLDKAEEARKQQMDYIRQATTPQTPEQQKTDILAQRNVMKDLYGPSLVPKYLEEVKAERTALPEKMESDKGLAFAMASLKLLSRNKKPGESQKSQLISGLGEAGEAFIGEVGRLKKEHKEADRLLRQSEIQLATADQLYNNGLIDKAIDKAGKAQALESRGIELHAGVAGKTSEMYAQLQNTKLGNDTSIAVANINADTSLRTAKMAAAKETDLNRQTNIRYAALIEQGKPANRQTMAEAAAMAAADLGKYSGVDRASDARATFYEKISDNVDIQLATQLGKKYRELQKDDKKTGGNSAQRYREQLIAAELDKARSQGQPTPGAAQPAPNAPAASPADQQAMQWAQDPKHANDPYLPAVKARLGLP